MADKISPWRKIAIYIKSHTCAYVPFDKEDVNNIHLHSELKMQNTAINILHSSGCISNSHLLLKFFQIFARFFKEANSMAFLSCIF